MFKIYLSGLRKHWWALMSCAAFTGLGCWVLYFNKSNQWTLWATFGLALSMLFVASFLTWKDENTRGNNLQSKINELTSRADITGQMFNYRIVDNVSAEWLRGKYVAKIVIEALIVNKSPFVSPTVFDFVCKLRFQDGEKLELSYAKDIGDDPSVTHRNKDGKVIGRFPSLAYFNDTPLGRDQHREGYLRFELPGLLVRKELEPVTGSLELIVVDGGGNSHSIKTVPWPYVREMRS